MLHSFFKKKKPKKKTFGKKKKKPKAQLAQTLGAKIEHRSKPKPTETDWVSTISVGLSWELCKPKILVSVGQIK